MGRPPTRTIEVPCPHCGQPMTVTNGLYLRELREQAGLTQRQFGKRIKASGPHISDWERNRRVAPDAVVEAYRALK